MRISDCSSETFFFQTPTQVILAYFFSKSLGQTQTPKEIQEALYFTDKNEKCTDATYLPTKLSLCSHVTSRR